MNIEQAAIEFETTKDFLWECCEHWLIIDATPKYNILNKLVNWDLDEHTNVPPVRPKFAKTLLENIELAKSGARPIPPQRGHAYNDTLDAYEFFSDQGFITDFNKDGIDPNNKKGFKNQLYEKLSRVNLTDRGKEFLDRQNRPEKYKDDNGRIRMQELRLYAKVSILGGDGEAGIVAKLGRPGKN